jgi:hypothetical protein
MKKIFLILVLFAFQAEAQRSVVIGALSGRNIASAPAGDAPVNTVVPVISDATPKVGEEITVTNGTWTNSPTSFSYQWSRDGLSITGATSNAYTPVIADYNLPLSCTVTATNSSGSANASATNTSNVLPANPVNTIAPVITGIYQSGQTLTCSQGTWTGQGTLTYAYQWKRNGGNISGATSSTYVTQVTDEETTLTCTVTSTNAGGSTSVTTNGALITDPSVSVITSNHVYSGSDKMLIYTPPGYSNNSNDYPVLFFYHGNGERGVPVDNNHLAGTGNGSQTVFSGSLNNTQRIIHSSVRLEVNGVQVATGRRGTITGSGVTGTYAFDTNSSAAFSITFTTAPTSGHQVRVYYTQSNLLGQGVFRYLNLGDEPNIIICAPQISAAEGGWLIGTHWTPAIDYLINNGYRVDTNRLYSTGLSLGGIFGVALANNWATLTYPFAAFADIAPGAVTGFQPGTSDLVSRRGKLAVKGTTDNFGLNSIASCMSSANGINTIFPFIGINYWNIGHSSALWDTKVYNRKNRTDATGTADFDYLEDYLLLFSLDLEEQADLWTTYAESTLVSDHYRIAKKEVDDLTAGAVKTALLARLAAVKTSIGNPVLIDFGTDFYSAAGNYNKVISPAVNANAIVQGTTSNTNLINDNGTSTGFAFTIVAATASSPSIINDVGAARLQGRQFGTVPYFTRDGMLVDAAGTTGTLKFSGLNNSKTYTIKIFVGASNTAWSARAEAEVTLGGVTKYAYCDTNNFRLKEASPTNSYIQYTGITPTSGEISFTLKSRLTANTERLFYLQGLELIENP